MNTKNPNHPANAIRCTDVRTGMRIIRNGQIHTVQGIAWYGFAAKVWLEDDTVVRVNAAGTMRLA